MAAVFSGIQTDCLWQTIHGKTTTGQNYAEPTFKLLDIMKQKHWRKLSLRSLTFSWQCTSAQVIGCSASCLQLWICSTEPSCLPSRLGSQWLFPNKKSEVPSSWNLTDDESLKIAVKAWFESQNRKFYFQRINSWEEKLKNALMLQEHMSKNDSIYDIIC